MILRNILNAYLIKRKDSKFYALLQEIGEKYKRRIYKIARKHSYEARTYEAIKIIEECKDMQKTLLMLLREYEKDDLDIILIDEIHLLEFIKIEHLYDCMEIANCYNRVGKILHKRYFNFLYTYIGADSIIGFTFIELLTISMATYITIILVN